MTNKISKFRYFSKSITLVVSFLILLSPLFVFAQNAPRPDPNAPRPDTKVPYSINIKNPFKSNDLKALIETIVKDILIPIGAVIATVMVIYAGFLFVTARGNSSQIQKAKEALLYAVIGAAILMGAWVITTAISATIDKLKIGA